MSKTILLADDSLTIQKVVELTFMEGDYEVVSVSNGDEALNRLEEMEVDLVIADIHMPGATGYEICRAVKAGRADTPVLLLVGTFEPFEPSEIEECGAEGHLKKPFDSQELLRLAEDLLLAPRLEGPVEQIDRVGEDEGGQGAGEIQQESDEASFVGISAEPATDETVSADAFAIEIESGETTEAVVETAESETEAQVGIEDQPVMSMSEEDVDRVARRVIELLSEEVVREIAWDVIPDLAEIVIKDRLRELESQVD